MVLALSLAAAGCSVLRSGRTDPARPAAYHSGGAYFLPMTLMTIAVKRSTANDVTVETPTVQRVPDPSLQFSLDYLTDISADDTFKVELDDQGLLKQVSATADDKKGPIIETVAATVLTLMTGVPVPVGAKRSLAGIPVGAIALTRTLNPNDAVAIAALNDDLRPFGIAMGVEPVRSTPGAPPVPDVAAATRDGRSGIFYRAPLPYIVSFSRPGEGPFQSYAVFSENASPIVAVDVSRSYFARRETTLTFKQGVLSSAEVKKPSELLGFVQIPLDLANAIVGIPAQLLQVRIDQTNQMKQLATAQEQLIQAQKKLIEATDPAAGAANEE